MSAGRAASPARRRAVAALEDFFSAGRRPLAPDAFDGSLSEADRDLATELIQGVLRHRSRLDRELGGALRFPMSRLQRPIREILEVALFQLRFLDRVPPRAAVHEAVELARGRAGEGASRLVNGVLRTLLREPPLSNGDDGLAIEFSHPDFLVDRWRSRWGESRARTMLAADNERPRWDLLFDARRLEADDLIAALRSERVEAEPSALSRCTLRVLSGNPLRTSLFARGELYVSDVGSQILPQLLPPGDRLLDLAAAPGGKSFAALFSGRCSRVLAVDRSLTRLRSLADNCRRLRVSRVCAAASDLKALAIGGRHDRVLLDAPCSGTGTLRKHPDIRYRLTPDGIAGLARTQSELLRAAAECVAPGGYLLYSTCSLEAEENESVVAEFLESRGEFGLEPIAAERGLAAYVSGALFRILPDEGSDGFTAHLLRRNPGVAV